MAKRGTRNTGSKNTQASKKKSSGKSASRGSGANTAVATPRLAYEQIANRAEEIWRQKGCPVGQDEQNWHEAERQLRNELGLQ